QGGRVECQGEVSAVVERYLIGSSVDDHGRREIELHPGDIRIVSWQVEGKPVDQRHACRSREMVTFEIEISSTAIISDAHIGFVIRSTSGDLLVSAQSIDDFQKRYTFLPGVSRVT